MKRAAPSLLRLASLAGLLLVTAPLRGAEILAARLYTEPERPFVNQPFTLHLLIDTTAGCQLQDLTVNGLPDQSVAMLQTFEARPVETRQEGGRDLARHHYVSAGRGVQPCAMQLQPSLGLTLVERRAIGFFSSWATTSRNVGLQPMSFAIRALPAAGVPEGFAGAVGRFTLTGRVEPAVVAPDDIVNLELDLRGVGHLGSGGLQLPPRQPHFKVYPPQENKRDPAGTLQVRQTLIPLDTNATMLATVRFPYFDPQDECYRVAAAGPFTLRFAPRKAESTPAVRHLAVPLEPHPAEGLPQLPDALQLELWRLLPAAAGGVAALLVGALWRPRRRWLGWVASLLLFLAVTAAGSLWRSRHAQQPLRVNAETSIRLAPAVASLELGRLPAACNVLPLERVGDWIRVDAQGRRGWIPAERLGAN